MFPVRPAPQLAAAFLIALAAPAGIAQAQTGAQSGAAMPQRYDLPAAPLAETLTRIARQSGHAVSVDPALVAAVRKQSASHTQHWTAAELKEAEKTPVAVPSSGAEPAAKEPPK